MSKAVKLCPYKFPSTVEERAAMAQDGPFHENNYANDNYTADDCRNRGMLTTAGVDVQADGVVLWKIGEATNGPRILVPGDTLTVE